MPVREMQRMIADLHSTPWSPAPITAQVHQETPAIMQSSAQHPEAAAKSHQSHYRSGKTSSRKNNTTRRSRWIFTPGPTRFKYLDNNGNALETLEDLGALPDSQTAQVI